MKATIGDHCEFSQALDKETKRLVSEKYDERAIEKKERPYLHERVDASHFDDISVDLVVFTNVVLRYY